MGKATKARDIIRDLRGDTTLAKSGAEFLDFGRVLLSGVPLDLAAGIALVTKTVATAIDAALVIAERLHTEDEEDALGLREYERFKALLYVTVTRLFLESIQEKLATLRDLHDLAQEARGGDRVAQLTAVVTARIDDLEKADISYGFGIEPLKGEAPLLSAMEEWFIATMLFYGCRPSRASAIAAECVETTRSKFLVHISSDTREATWMRNFLCLLDRGHEAEIADSLASVRDALSGWISKADTPLAQRTAPAWDAYRQDLETLPDQRETMYDESFGVRDVFVRPGGTYHIAGTGSSLSTPSPVQDLGMTLGALVSERTSPEDFIILCGGPGSGKSTVCRFLASELASDPHVHPVFIKLRTVQEAADIVAYIEAHMQRLGLIERSADLRELPNLVVILDGFDELVMASREKLKQFFNALRDDKSTGLLKRARVVLSGRDTLFPQGHGLPAGSHVLVLLPFDQPRVAAWAERWRSVRRSPPERDFDPSPLLARPAEGGASSPIAELVSQPLTLHLVARAHTAGRLDVSLEKAVGLQKAYLYRSIVAEAISRQQLKDATAGRLEPRGLSWFVRQVAWKMYSQARDSLELSEVMPLIAALCPGDSGPDPSDLAEVAVLSAPHLRRGEEKGFEFIHKSFCEYFAAEVVAEHVERLIFTAPEYGTRHETWRTSDSDAAATLAGVFGVRLLTAEVQEMLEPMLGALTAFQQGFAATDTASVAERAPGLSKVLDRMQGLYLRTLQGEALQTVLEWRQREVPSQNPLEVHARFLAGCMLVGSAAAHNLTRIGLSDPTPKPPTYFVGEPFEGAFWQAMSTLTAGGLQLTGGLDDRLFSGMSVAHKELVVCDSSHPMPLAAFSTLAGYESEVLDEALLCYSISAFQDASRRPPDGYAAEDYLTCDRSAKRVVDLSVSHREALLNRFSEETLLHLLNHLVRLRVLPARPTTAHLRSSMISALERVVRLVVRNFGIPARPPEQVSPPPIIASFYEWKYILDMAAAQAISQLSVSQAVAHSRPDESTVAAEPASRSGDGSVEERS